MSKATTIPRQGTAQDVHTEQWIPFLAEFTRENRGAHARLEVVGANTDVGYQVEAENRPFDGVAADVKDSESIVWITFGARPEDHLTHGVHSVTAIRTLPATPERGPVLEVESQDGTRTVLHLSLPEAYELPPAERENRRS